MWGKYKTFCVATGLINLASKYYYILYIYEFYVFFIKYLQQCTEVFIVLMLIICNAPISLLLLLPRQRFTYVESLLALKLMLSYSSVLSRQFHNFSNSLTKQKVLLVNPDTCPLSRNVHRDADVRPVRSVAPCSRDVRGLPFGGVFFFLGTRERVNGLVTTSTGKKTALQQWSFVKATTNDYMIS